ncbi:MAG: hypothetical protein HYT36_00160 [Candidatus Staskawiczbacteria bacterium]|nr:hypothetical protein [Candidatus Staskawiczbacteria bacterium]
MAIVFISPRHRQRIFILGVTSALALAVAIIFFVVFFAGPEEPSSLIFNKPKASVNVNFLNSNELKNLEPFAEMETEFVYEALTSQKKRVSGNIWAVSKQEAIRNLEELGLSVGKIDEVLIGKDNPFEPYY